MGGAEPSRLAGSVGGFGGDATDDILFGSDTSGDAGFAISNGVNEGRVDLGGSMATGTDPMVAIHGEGRAPGV